MSINKDIIIEELRDIIKRDNNKILSLRRRVDILNSKLDFAITTLLEIYEDGVLGKLWNQELKEKIESISDGDGLYLYDG